MNRPEFERVLRDAERAHRLERVRAALDRLLTHVREPWVDSALFNRVARLATRCERVVQGHVSTPLEIGESWLLLAESTGQGRAVRMRVAPIGSPGPLLNRHETFAAVRGLAACASGRGHLVSVDSLGVAWELVGGGEGERVTGDSLGLSTCVSLLSTVSKRAPHSHVSGTASVDPSTGALKAVHHVRAKLDALRASWPEVTHVVVAAQQEVPEDCPFELSRCEDVGKAVTHFGFTLDALPKPLIGHLQTMVSDFERQDALLHSLSEWAALSTHALGVAGLLDGKRPEDATQARIWAALFSSHAADNHGAAAIVKSIDVGRMRKDEHLVMRAVVLATATIDEDAGAAADLGGEAVLVAERLREAGGAAWYGRALGTHGRALMHAGAYGEAEKLLRKAYEHHKAACPEEAGRSACYLACCLRHAGRPDEALSAADLALNHAESESDFEGAQSTRPYALLERSRALGALGHAESALASLTEVIGTERLSHRYPRLGAHRTLAAVYRELGRFAEAEDHLRICWAVAGDMGFGKTARKVGAVAAAEELAHAASTRRRPCIAADELEPRWRALFGDGPRDVVLKTWIY